MTINKINLIHFKNLHLVIKKYIKIITIGDNMDK